MKEYGGYLELERNDGEEYYPESIKLNSGCNCLRYLIRTKKIKKIYIPYYLCECIETVCRQEKVKIQKYFITEKFCPVEMKECNETDYFYLVNYFGQLSVDYIVEAKKKCKNVILDNAQNFFQVNYKKIYSMGIDIIYTCRKYFGVPDGAYLLTNAREMRIDCNEESSGRMGHLVGRFETKGSFYYKDYLINEQYIELSEIKLMSKNAQNLLKGINYEKVKGIRNNNFLLLQDKLREYNLLNPEFTQGAYMYPLFLENGSAIREQLLEYGVYIPVFWKEVDKYVEEQTLEGLFSKHLLPIPSDQRYTDGDMRELVNLIIKIMKR